MSDEKRLEELHSALMTEEELRERRNRWAEIDRLLSTMNTDRLEEIWALQEEARQIGRELAFQVRQRRLCHWLHERISRRGSSTPSSPEEQGSKR